MDKQIQDFLDKQRKKTILFRGKDIKTNEWVKGSLLSKFDGDAGSYCQFFIIEKYNFSRGADDDSSFYDCEPIEVREETIGQFTRLLDKNGVEIFEGDIVNSAHPLADTNDDGELIPFVIKYTDEDVGSCGCCYPCFTGVGFVGESVNGTRVSGEVRVVGNIWDNPELLKED